MLHYRFKSSAQVMLVSIGGFILFALLFSLTQPIGAALGAVLQQTVAGTSTVPPYLNYQGMLRDAEGKPISGVQKLTFRIYKDVTAPLPEALWVEEHNEVTVRDGQFSVLLGNNKPIPPELFTGPDLFIGVTVAPLDEMVPRQRFASAPYAMVADHATALTAPNGSTHVVHVDNTGRVGVGTTSPQAQLQISATTGSALQVNAGGQQMVVNPTGVGIGTTAPAVPLQIRNDDPDMMLDINAASTAPRGEYAFGVDGQRRATVYYDKTTGKAGMENGQTQLNLYTNGLVETIGSLGVNGVIHTTGNAQIDGELYLGVPGQQPRKPVLIKRFSGLPEDQELFDTGISANVYQCTTGAWSTGRYDISEDSRDADMAWVFIGGNANWYIHTKFMSDGQPDETPHIDVLCFLNGLVEYDESSGNRWDGGE
ncbi:MAG: hypothetical protein NT075_28460 [Chloroflexi bacterium]|nr:hypothetical protein [Chloroflexota bacterium]